MESGLPLANWPLVNTTCPSEAESVLSRSLAACRILRVAHRPGFRLEMNGLALGRTSILFNQFSAACSVEGDLRSDPVFLVFGTGGPSTFHVGNGSSVTVSPQTAAMIANVERMRIDRTEGSGVLVVRAEFAELRHQFEALAGRHHRGPLVFNRTICATKGVGAMLRRLISFVIGELEQDASVLNDAAIRRSFDEMLLSGLLSLPHSRSNALDAGSRCEVAPGVVKRAEEYMRAHLGEPLAVSDLLRICDCSRSALFSAFRRSRGCTPKEFLTEQRLQCARDLLLRSGAPASVTSIAIDCGYPHLGRFAETYRRRFGESPSETLRRARAK